MTIVGDKPGLLGMIQDQVLRDDARLSRLTRDEINALPTAPGGHVGQSMQDAREAMLRNNVIIELAAAHHAALHPDQTPRRVATDAEIQLGRRLPHQPPPHIPGCALDPGHLDLCVDAAGHLLYRPATRTPEAQADIEAARATPVGLEVAMQEVDRAAEQAMHEHRNAPMEYRPRSPEPLAPHLGYHYPTFLPHKDQGGPGCCHAQWLFGCRMCAEWAVRNAGALKKHFEEREFEIGAVAEAIPALAQVLFAHRMDAAVADQDPHDEACKDRIVRAAHEDAIVLTGLEADRYRAMQSAALAAHEAAKAGRSLAVVALLPHDNGGPACNHVLWTIGCMPCAKWALDHHASFMAHMLARPTGIEVAMQEIEHAAEQALTDHRDAPTAYPPIDPADLPFGALLLAGPQAERYRQLEIAARRSHEAGQAAQVAAHGLRDAFHAFCAGVAPAPTFTLSDEAKQRAREAGITGHELDGAERRR